MAEKHQVQQSYDAVAQEYAEHIYGELAHKPLDRYFLERFARQVTGPIWDLGCGPGHTTQFLHQLGVDVTGSDLSAGMVAVARQLNPDIEFRQIDMTALDIKDSTLGGIVSYYSIVNSSHEDVARAVREFWRALRPGGSLLIAFHQGTEVRHFDEWLNHQVALDFFFFERTEIEGYLREAGFAIEESLERAPYADIEVQTTRAYILARKL
jgi:SAM-dependent methyltransferase